MKFSIVVMVFRDGTAVKAVLESLLAQDIRDWECLVVDCSSSPACRLSVRAYEARCSGRLQYCSVSGKNPAFAMNRGIAGTMGDLLCFLGEGDRLVPGALKAVLDEWRRMPEAALYYGIARCLDREGREIALIRQSHHALEDCAVQPSACFFCRSVLQKCGGFNLCYPRMAVYELQLGMRREEMPMRPVDALVVATPQGRNLESGNILCRKEGLLIRRKFGLVSCPGVFLKLIRAFVVAAVKFAAGD